MGNTKIRRMSEQCKSFHDKTSIRHKHDYSDEVLADVRDLKDYHSYYIVRKCRHCGSFKDAVFVSIEEAMKSDLPVVKYFRSHRWSIGFSDIRLDE